MMIDTEFLVVGAGPAGAALACFLGQNGAEGIVISKAPSTADTPRAHLINPFATECLRDIGAEDDAKRMASTGSEFRSMRWCRSMVGQEYGKVLCWGGHPDTKRDMDVASPCDFMDLPQTYLEPILVKHASHTGFQIRFSTDLVGIERAGSSTICTVNDMVTHITYQIRTRYLFGADGGRSYVARSLKFNFLAEPSSGVACNILINADLAHLMHGRESQLHWVMKPDGITRFGTAPVLRMIRPWKQWLLVAFCPGVSENPFKDLVPNSPELIEFIKEVIGDENFDIEVLRLDPWVVRESVAKNYCINDEVFLLGDAAHRHPPAFGLGSNTCIQDAYNLAWKVAYTSKGIAGPGLLNSYNAERQPVGAELVRAANDEMSRHVAVWEALGMFGESPEDGQRQIHQLSEATDEGAARRQRLHNAFEGKRREGESLGMTMNQRYYNSDAVYFDDEADPPPEVEGDFHVKIRITSYPGNRLPHAWLDKPTRGNVISTQDLAGHGSFCLLTGIGGEAWTSAARKISRNSKIPITTHSIGFGLDYHDVYREWEGRREIREDGCLLVRPDRFIAWRSMGMITNCEEKLTSVLNRILFRGELNITHY